MSPELYWYVSNSLGEIDMPLKHVPDSKQALTLIQKELPKIVILNHDDPNLNVADLIGKMRNHVFARNTLFLVFSSNYSLESRRQLVIQGAAQVFYRLGNTYPKPKVFSNTIHWLLNLKNKENKFEFEYIPLESDAQITTWGRIGQITNNEFIIESNLDISPGDAINVTSPIFDDLQIKGAQFVCTEKNTIGRYYQYTNSFKGKIVTKHNEQDIKKIQSFVS
jgi:CheY-like chemotaxis protein